MQLGSSREVQSERISSEIDGGGRAASASASAHPMQRAMFYVCEAPRRGICAGAPGRSGIYLSLVAGRYGRLRGAILSGFPSPTGVRVRGWVAQMKLRRGECRFVLRLDSRVRVCACARVQGASGSVPLPGCGMGGFDGARLPAGSTVTFSCACAFSRESCHSHSGAQGAVSWITSAHRARQPLDVLAAGTTEVAEEK